MDEEQSQPRRYVKSKTGEPRPLAIPSDQLSRLPPPTRTDDDFDEGYTDLPRTNSSIRYTNPRNTQIPRTTGMPPMNTPMRRPTGPRNSDAREPGRKTGPRNADPYEASYQDEGKETNTGRQSSVRENNAAYTAGRQTTRNIPSSQTRDYPRTQNKTRDYPRNAAPGRARELPGRPKKRVHWFLPVGIGMLAMLALWLVGSNIVGWGTQFYNDYHYGNPRTFQTDAVVGHNHDSKAHPSHFIAVNLNRQAVVFEIMAGDPQKGITYVVPGTIAGDGGDRVPVTIEFRDVTNDHLIDMIVHIHLPSQDQISIFINDGSKFRPSTSTDKIYLS